MREADVLVLGGGVVGLATAWGLVKQGVRVTVIDAGRPEPRASTANFGLVWLQSKGDGFPAYGLWTRRAVDAWPAFAAELAQASGIDTGFRATGGLGYCLGEAEWEARTARVARMSSAHAIDPYGTVMLDRAELQRKLAGAELGREVVGASWNPHEGTVDPLKLLHALRIALRRTGAGLVHESPVENVAPAREAFEIEAAGVAYRAPRVVLAAGLGNNALAPRLGIPAQVRADRGQILVTERVPWTLPLPANGMRQTLEGTVMIGSTREGADANLQTTDAVRAAGMAQRAVRIFPALARARITRVWAGLRTLSADSAPVYARSLGWPGAVAINCHSGITLAPLHAGVVASWAAGGADASVAPFTAGRFDVPSPA